MLRREMSLSLVLVEDDADMRLILTELLTAFGASVQVFAGSAAAQAAPVWEEADVAILDWMMPEISGMDMARWLRDHHPVVRRILLTAAPEALRHTHPDVDGLAAVISKDELPHGLFAALGMV